MLEPFAHSPLGKASSRETSVNEPSSPMPKDSWKSGLLKAAIKREKNLTGLQPLRDLAIQIDCIVQLTFLDARAVCAFPSRESIEPRDECERAVLSDAKLRGRAAFQGRENAQEINWALAPVQSCNTNRSHRAIDVSR